MDIMDIYIYTISAPFNHPAEQVVTLKVDESAQSLGIEPRPLCDGLLWASGRKLVLHVSMAGGLQRRSESTRVPRSTKKKAHRKTSSVDEATSV